MRFAKPVSMRLYVVAILLLSLGFMPSAKAAYTSFVPVLKKIEAKRLFTFDGIWSPEPFPVKWVLKANKNYSSLFHVEGLDKAIMIQSLSDLTAQETRIKYPGFKTPKMYMKVRPAKDKTSLTEIRMDLPKNVASLRYLQGLAERLEIAASEF